MPILQIRKLSHWEMKRPAGDDIIERVQVGVTVFWFGGRVSFWSEFTTILPQPP